MQPCGRRAEFADSSQETPGLVGVNFAARVNFIEGTGTGSGDSVERAGNGPLAANSRLRGPFCFVPPCVTVSRCRLLCCGIHGHSVRAVRTVGETVGFPRTATDRPAPAACSGPICLARARGQGSRSCPDRESRRDHLRPSRRGGLLHQRHHLVDGTVNLGDPRRSLSGATSNSVCLVKDVGLGDGCAAPQNGHRHGLASCRVVGWVMADHMRASLV